MLELTAALEIVRTTRDPYLIGSVYMNVGFLLDAAASRGEPRTSWLARRSRLAARSVWRRSPRPPGARGTSGRRGAGPRSSDCSTTPLSISGSGAVGASSCATSGPCMTRRPAVHPGGSPDRADSIRRCRALNRGRRAGDRAGQSNGCCRGGHQGAGVRREPRRDRRPELSWRALRLLARAEADLAVGPNHAIGQLNFQPSPTQRLLRQLPARPRVAADDQPRAQTNRRP